MRNSASSNSSSSTIHGGGYGNLGGVASSDMGFRDRVKRELGRGFTSLMVGVRESIAAHIAIRFGLAEVPKASPIVDVSFHNEGSSLPISEIPVVMNLEGKPGTIKGAIIQTSSVDWAVMRITGLDLEVLDGVAGDLLVRDFKIGGSPNLLLNGGWIRAARVSRDGFGLRAYPIMISPNSATVECVFLADVRGEIDMKTVRVDAAIQVEILRDDAFGPGLPGAYAR